MSSHLKSLILPFTVILIVPGIILWLTGFRIGWGLQMPMEAVIVLIGAVMIGNGVYYLAMCIWIFIKTGNGTMEPWAQTKKLVIFGPYRSVRNPMIGSALLVLLGESIAFGSIGIFAWFVLCFGANHLFFVFREEPALEKRFGEEYRVYKKSVPRWIPRWRW